jgi:TrmH family RNA methyltransferase
MNPPILITSKDNQHLKFARRVRDRKEDDLIFIEGKRLCREAVSSGVEIEKVFVSERLKESEFAAEIGGSIGEIFVIGDELLDSIADTDSPQGIVMIARRPRKRTVHELFQFNDGLPLWLFLVRPNNPSNLGALCRTAEAAGSRGAFLGTGSADPFASKTLRASMGSVFRFPIAPDADHTPVFGAARSKAISVIAMDAEGGKDYLELDWTKPTLLVVGNEASGLSTDCLAEADEVVRIDMKQPVESLNLAVSAGIVLFEAVRQSWLSDR